MKNKKVIISLKSFPGFKIRKIHKRIMSIGRLYLQINGHAGTIALKRLINLILSGKTINLAQAKETLMGIVVLLEIKVKFQLDYLINKK